MRRLSWQHARRRHQWIVNWRDAYNLLGHRVTLEESDKWIRSPGPPLWSMPECVKAKFSAPSYAE